MMGFAPKERMLGKVRGLERTLQAYLKNLDLYEKNNIRTVTIMDHRQITRTFLELTEVVESLLEDELMIASPISTVQGPIPRPKGAP